MTTLWERPGEDSRQPLPQLTERLQDRVLTQEAGFMRE